MYVLLMEDGISNSDNIAKIVATKDCLCVLQCQLEESYHPKVEILAYNNRHLKFMNYWRFKIYKINKIEQLPIFLWRLNRSTKSNKQVHI